MAEGVAPYYVLQNYGSHRNCTITASFPAVVSIESIEVGGTKGSVNYDVSSKSSREASIFTKLVSPQSAIKQSLWIRLLLAVLMVSTLTT